MSKLTICLTNEQRQQIKDATGKSVTELHLDFSANGQLASEQLDRVQGGFSFGASNAADVGGKGLR
jgi:propanediol dehydratase small subunit